MKIFIALFSGTLLLTSCSKWLDVKPQSQVAATDLFDSQEGFEEATNGLYSRCSQQAAYGDELSFGFLDVLAQNYYIDFHDYQHYVQTSIYNYKDAYFISRKDTVWTGLYNAIANSNLILDNIENGKKLLTPVDYGVIKGEALAMRAYLHFDLLRMFAPSYGNNPSAPAIPYVTAFSNKVTPLSTVSQVLTLVLQDLNAAKGLLKPVDPILSAGYIIDYPWNSTSTTAPPTRSTEQSNASLFLQNRRNRLNYYAVCGELARAYLYMNKQDSALSNALEVINSKKFPWTDPGDFTNPDPQNVDRILYKELLFSWYIPTLGKTLVNRFAQPVGLYLDQTGGTNLYQTNGVGGADTRYKEWLSPLTDANGQWLTVAKYKRDPDTNRHPLLAPALRLSEVYYIAAECSYDANPSQAMGYVDSVRFHRGIPDPLTATGKQDFLNQLLAEARKELYGEGQIFYMFKRMGLPITSPSGIGHPATNNIFVLPLPNSEIEYGGR